jgi:hypothetical protein
VKKFSKFFLEMTPLGVKTCGESEFEILETKNASLIQRRLVYLSEKSQNATFRFNTQAFPESGKRFLLRKCQIQILECISTN